MLLVPGLVNGHTACHGALGKGPGRRSRATGGLPVGRFGRQRQRGLADKKLSATLAAVELVRKACTSAFDLFAEFPAPTREGGMDAVAEAYAMAGMRAVVAPMMADRTLYEALPGLTESFPRRCGKRSGACPQHRSSRASRHAGTSSTTGPITAHGCARHSARPSRYTARMIS